MMENESLVVDIQNGVNVNENMLQLFNQNKRFMYQQIKRYLSFAESDDLEQESFLALYDAVGSFKQESELSFLTYYGNSIRWRISRYVAQNQSISVPENLQNDVNRYKAFLATYRAEHGTTPEDLTVQAELNIDRAGLKRIKTALERISVVSLNSLISNEDDTELIETIAGPNNTELVEDVFDKDIRHKIITEQIDQLEPLQRNVIYLSFYEGLNNSQISKEVDCPESKTRYVKAQAIHKLRKAFWNINKKTKLFQEYERVGTGVYSNHGFTHTFTSSTEYVALRRLEIEQMIKEIEDEYRNSKEQYQEDLSRLCNSIQRNNGE